MFDSTQSTIIALTLSCIGGGAMVPILLISRYMYKEKYRGHGPIGTWYGYLRGRPRIPDMETGGDTTNPPELEVPAKIHEMNGRSRIRELEDPRTCHELDPVAEPSRRHELPGVEFPELMGVALREGIL